MLRELYVENLAVIEKATIRFLDGFTVFTGETGAGKSILIDAINLVLGQRSNKEVVRTGTDKAVVSALFSHLNCHVLQKLSDYGYEVENDEIVITREISTEGKSIARLMGRPITVSLLRELGADLVTVHGQHDNQILLTQERHIDILDSYADNQPFEQSTDILTRYQQEYDQFTKLKRQYQKVNLDEQQKARKLDLLTYQVEEIEAVNPKVGEDEQIEQSLNMMRNAQKISENLSAAYRALSGQEEVLGSYDLTNQAIGLLDEIADYNQNIQKVEEQLETVRYEMEEVTEKISDFLESLEYDPAVKEQLEQRFDEIHQLKRKYGNTIEEIVNYYQNAKSELQQIQHSDQLQEELLEQLNQQKAVVVKLGKELSQMRQKTARRFEQAVSQELAFLDMPNVVLKVEIEKAKYGIKGCDVVAFLFSTNLGETPKPLGKIASGGELSRIMLAIKSVLAQKDAVDTLIFDEIDTGVSGKSAQKIGKKLKSVSTVRQVLCVTHSAQIAALADEQFLISKQTQGERTYTNVMSLDTDGRIWEIARIMATDQITDLMLQNAREMLIAAKNNG